jgi:hypothetical protein
VATAARNVAWVKEAEVAVVNPLTGGHN